MCVAVWVRCDAVCVLQCAAACCSVLQYVAVCCSTLQCVAVYCSVYDMCVAVRYSMLQCVAVYVIANVSHSNVMHEAISE